MRFGFLEGSLIKFTVSALVASCVFWASSSYAATEQKCAKQYSLEEHLILEWAALGGDPHAQFALTQCAFPIGTKKLSQSEKIYALKWLSIATCDVVDDDAMHKRNARTRRLKDQGDLSFRRFGGEQKSKKKPPTREKMFREYRSKKVSELKQRNADIAVLVDENDRRKARNALITQFSSMGEIGYLRLAEMASCPHFDATETFAAASWSAAGDTFSGSVFADVSGNSEKRGWNPSKEADRRISALAPEQQMTVAFEKDQLMANRPEDIEALRNRAAIANLRDLATAHVHASETTEPTKSVILAVQYALEALGMIEFTIGPDNDYGPTTVAAVEKLQASHGTNQSKWMDHQEIRDTICKAASETADPISMYYLAIMYSNGWGYPQDYNKARFAIDRAEKAMKIRLDNSEELLEWKQERYPLFVPEIEAEKILINAAWKALPGYLKTDTVDPATLCK